LPTSPCIDAGDPTFSPTSYSPLWTTDIDDEDRINVIIEMGFDEYYSSSGHFNTKAGGVFEEPESSKVLETVNIELYPNPASDHVFVRADYDGDGSGFIRVYDLTGALIFETNVTSEETRISLKDVPNGVYLVRYKETTSKISVQH